MTTTKRHSTTTFTEPPTRTRKNTQYFRKNTQYFRNFYRYFRKNRSTDCFGHIVPPLKIRKTIQKKYWNNWNKIVTSPPPASTGQTDNDYDAPPHLIPKKMAGTAYANLSRLFKMWHASRTKNPISPTANAVALPYEKQ